MVDRLTVIKTLLWFQIVWTIFRIGLFLMGVESVAILYIAWAAYTIPAIIILALLYANDVESRVHRNMDVSIG
jgi:hypothetical protein